MHTLHTALAETLVKDRLRDLHRIAGNSRPHREAGRRRERQRR